MDLEFFDDVRKRPLLIPTLIIVSSIVSLLLNAYGLMLGITNVLPHIFYIPLILTAYYYPRRGVLFAVVLSACYCAMSFTIGNLTSIDLLSAVVTFMRIYSDCRDCILPE